MAEYIEREALRNEILKISIDTSNLYGCGVLEGLDRATKRINETPAADVEEVIHAHWEMVEREAFWLSDSDIWMKSGKPTIRLMPVCSHCKTEFGKIVLDFKRCPECGAKMDGERRSE